MSVINFPTISVHPLTEASIAESSQLQHDCWHLTYDDHLPGELIAQHDAESFHDYLKKKQPRTWIARYDNQLAGVLVISLNCIDELCVDPRYRRKKIGRRLIDVAISNCHEKGYQSIQTGIEDFNHGALQFLQAVGWREAGSDYVPITRDQQVKALVYSRVCANS